MVDSSAYRLGICAALAVLLLVVLELALRVFSKAPSLRQNETQKNPADALRHAGDVIATLLVAGTVGDMATTGESVKTDLLRAAGFGVTATLLFLACSRAQTRFFLAQKLTGEVERGNPAAGLAAAAHSVATGILAANAVAGETLHDLGLSLVFFVLGQVALLVLVALFRTLTVYDDSEEILGENMAASLSYAGITIGVAVLVGRASSGEFTTWGESLLAFAEVLAYAPLLYFVRQFVVGSVVLGHKPALRGGPLDKAIGAERNVGLAALEAATYIGTALVVERLP
jgi:uncharacterized membrane protein YjfL (UPF0719 family)